MLLRNKISGKKILFFSVQTFNLEKEIKNKMEENGAIVTYYDERPSNSNFTKGIIRLKRAMYQKKIDAYYQSILDSIRKETFDFLFVNRGEVITANFLKEFKKLQPNCEMIFFTWDSFTNHSHPTTILQYFEKRFSFDREDAEKYNIGFRPLFYLDKYKKIKKESSSNYKYDLLFLGTAHSDRYIISSKVAEWCVKNGFRTFTYYYMHSKAVYFYQKIFDKSFREFDYKKLSFNSLSTDQIVDLYKNSNIILDINHPGQKGLTMRTFETIGAGKKMITTNEEIKKYPFYSPDIFYVIDRNDIILDPDFFSSSKKIISDELYYRCSIEGWLSDIFLKDEKDDWKSIMNIN
ncbi:lipopolysaccharide biosynthesis protein [Epilithonimonas arachidiradicis]|uniref:Lipopolysaccharide biosynthesis protein n=2 Tax=Epilithonimonas arachidiradicis TaxID=1617282 RepID=A0A420DC37_9FLAO|nr:lipopolysaccharide biosynthesis protein [Epilithonimonas arachidiradicis]RKE89012.1 hypothetical protein BXY58_1146 [Epilithonimonas arachidiradicis]